MNDIVRQVLAMKAASANGDFKTLPIPAPLSKKESTPAPPPMPLHEILDAISKFFRRYVVFPDPAYPDVLALWVAHVWVIEAFQFTPYLYVDSPEKRCGKSLLLDCLELICKNPVPAVAPTGPTLYRLIQAEKPASLELIFDEMDGTFSAKGTDESTEALRMILNAGFQRGRWVPRCVGPTNKVEKFDVFCPKVIAGINNGRLPDTILDRSIIIHLERKTEEETVEKWRSRKAKLVSLPIRCALDQWSKSPDVVKQLKDAEPDRPDELRDRVGDITEPLLAIADMAGNGWKASARKVLMKACVEISKEDTEGVQLLGAFYEIFTAAEGKDAFFTSEIIHKLIAREGEPWAEKWERSVDEGRMKGPAHGVAKILKKYHISPQDFRLGPDVKKGYKLEWFRAAFQRYLGIRVYPGKDATKATNATFGPSKVVSAGLQILKNEAAEKSAEADKHKVVASVASIAPSFESAEKSPPPENVAFVANVASFQGYTEKAPKQPRTQAQHQAFLDEAFEPADLVKNGENPEPIPDDDSDPF